MKHGHGKHNESRGKDRGDERGSGDYERQQREWARDNQRGPSREQYTSQGYDHEPRDSRDHWASGDSRSRGDFYGSGRDSRYGYDQGNSFSSGDRQHREEPNRSHHDHRFDPDYLQWRDEQMRALDRDYLAWRKDRYDKFSQEFNQWREGNRQSARNDTALGASLKATDDAAQEQRAPSDSSDGSK